MIKVSVLIATYNQKNYIAQAIESALDQQTNFDYEILVGDDCSTDGTQEVVLEYEKKYPNRVKAVLHPKNLGQNGLFNAIETLKLTKGEYVTVLDGDDYYIHPYRLQKLADFLDKNPSFTAAFHNTKVVYEYENNRSELLNSPNQKAEITIDDLIGEDEIWFMGTSAVMFRKALVNYDTCAPWVYRSTSGDIPRYILLAKQGPIGYIPDVMSVYRKNRAGVSFKDDYKDAAFLYNRIQMYAGINHELNYRFDKILKRNIARYFKMMLEARQYQESYWRRAVIALRYIWWGKPEAETTKEIIRDYVIPKWLMNIYSFFALFPHRLKG
jgi:glycosyltransferase involved in cell wall biosynthesis